MNGQIDKTLLSKHPSLQMLDADVQIATASIKLEKAKMYPSLFIGISSGSMYGTGSDNKDYTYSTRFNNAQLGIGIPIFTKQKQVVNASKINAEVYQNGLEIEKKYLDNQFDISLKQFEVQKEIVDELEKISLPNGKLIFETAQKQFLNGDINYLEWAMLVNQSIAVQSNYQDAILKLNENTIQLIYLLNAG